MPQLYLRGPGAWVPRAGVGPCAPMPRFDLARASPWRQILALQLIGDGIPDGHHPSDS